MSPLELKNQDKVLKLKHFISVADMTADDIGLVLDTAEGMKEISQRPIKKVPALQGKTVVNLFFEPSTRTRTSFEIAGKRLGADTINFSGSSSSASKGETLIDTARNIEAMYPDLIVIRHPSSGAPYMLSKHLDCSIVNAGDGAHEHPTQAMLDAFTIREHKKSLKGLKIAIIGDITHSRVARSDLLAFTKLGASVTLAGPPTLIPPGIDKLGAKTTFFMEEAIEGADVVMMLRIQLERIAVSPFPSLREYSERWGLNLKNLELAKPDAIVMHPGPINRGVEMSHDVADGPRSVILDQVNNGVAVRMAILYLLIAGKQAAAE